MRRILQIVKPYWPRIALAILCSLVISAMNGSLAFIVQPVVDDVLVQGRHMSALALAIFLIFVCRGAFQFFQNYLIKSVGAKVIREMRTDMYGHMVYLPMSHFGTDTIGKMISRVINDTTTLQQFLALGVRAFFVSLGSVVVLMGVALYRRWDLTLIAIVVLPFALFAVGKLGKRLKKVTRRAQERIAEITDALSEGLSGIRLIKIYSTEDDESKSVRNHNSEYYREFMRITRIEEATGITMELLAGIGVGLIVFYGGTLVARAEMSTGDFLSFLAAIMLIYTPAKRLAHTANQLQMAKVVIDRIDEVMATEKELEGTVELQPLNESIEYRDVSFRYPGRLEYALQDINLAVRKGEMIALVGRSGAGKSTLVDLLTRFYPLTKGAIVFDGVDIANATLRSLRLQVGVVSQDVFLFNDTVRNNIAYGRNDVGEDDIVRAAKAAYAHDFILELPKGYDTPIGQRGHLLSGGQRQRISIARAIIDDPPVLVLDEATSSLDTQSEIIVQRALDDLMEKSSSGGMRTTFVIAHRLSTIRRADRIVMLEGGRIAEVGSHDELIAAGGIYHRLYSMQHGGAGNLDLDATAL